MSPKQGSEAGKAIARQMAHFSPKVIQTKRRMAHPVRRGPLWSLRNALAGLLPIANEPVPALGSGDAPAPSSTSRRRREFAVVLALLVVAAVISASLPGGWAAPSATPSASAILAAAATSPEPTDTPFLESPDPTPSDTPFESPSASPSTSPTAAPVVTPKKPTVITFVALGDSLTAWPSGNPWPVRLDAEDTRIRMIHNAGVPGDLVGDMRARLNSDVFYYNPQVLLILGGTNDVGKGLSQTAALANMKAIIVAAKARKIRVYLITIPPDSLTRLAGSIDTWNASLQSLANAYRIVLIDIHDYLSTPTGVYQSKYTSDGIHFSNLGAQTVANIIYGRLHHLGY